MSLIPDSTPARKNPFVGPRSFKEGEPFHGRNRETIELANLLIAERIVLLYSPSGAGKTSLINAALLPKLATRRFAPLPTMRVNLEPPPGLLGVEGFNRYTFSALSSLEKHQPESQHIKDAELAKLSLAQYLDQRGMDPERGASAKAPILIFDQFEEVLMVDSSDLAEKKAFFAQLGSALEDPNRWALFSMREDYIAGLDPYLLAVPTHFRNTFRLELLSLTTARHILQQTTLQEKVTFAEEAADRLITDLSRVRVQKLDGSIEDKAGVTVEPVQMQVVCFNLWEKLDPDVKTITLQEIETIGDVDQALGDYYSTQIAVVAQERDVPERTLRRWFDQVLITPSGIRNQVLLEKDASQGLQNDTIYHLEDAHLVRLESGRNRTWVELAHDRLVAPVRSSNAAWFDSHLSVLQRQAVIWEKEKRPPDLLLRESALEQAESEAAADPDDLTESELDFLEESRLAHQQELEEKESQKRELEEQKRTSKMLRRRLLYAGVALAIAIVACLAAFVFAVVAGDALEDAEAQAFRARVGELSGQVFVQLEDHHDTAMLLGIEAFETEPSLQTRQALYSVWKHNPQLIQIFQGHTSWVRSVAFSPDGLTLASGSQDGTIRLWDPQTGQPIGEPLFNHSDTVNSVAISPDGLTLASGSQDGTIRLWDMQTGQPLGEPLEAHAEGVLSVAFSPDGQTLVSGSVDGTLGLWDVQTGQPRANSPAGHDESIRSVEFSPDGQILVSSSDDDTIRLWDVETGQPRGEPLAGHGYPVTDVAFSPPDGKTLASASDDGTLRLWDVETGQPIGEPLLGHGSWVLGLTFSPDGQTLASGSADGTIRLWDAQTGQPIGEPLKGHSDWVNSVAFSPDGLTLASASDDGTLRLWGGQSGQSSNVFLEEFTSWIVSSAFNPVGQILAAGSEDGTLRLWDAQTGQPIGEPLEGHSDLIRSLAFSPDGKTLASAADDLTIRLWDAQTGQPRGEPLSGHTDWIRSLAFSPDGQTLASGSDDGSLRLWNTQSGQPIGEPLTGHEGWVRSVAFSPDGETLVSASNDFTVRQWDPQTGQPLGEPLTGHQAWVTIVAYSLDGQVLASGSNDGILRLWNAQTGQPIAEPLAGHSDFDINSLAFSPDGETLASGSDDGTLRLWDALTGQPLGEPLERHPAAVESLAFSPDGQSLISASADGSIHLWDIDPQLWIQALCQRAGRNLTAEEWNQHLSWNVSYDAAEKTCPQWPGNE